jgi:hypothetical protein
MLNLLWSNELVDASFAQCTLGLPLALTSYILIDMH